MGDEMHNRVEEATRRAVAYVRARQTEDGGYFFARIPPGCLRDSYFAVQMLRMVGERAARPEDFEGFIQSFLSSNAVQDAHGLYLLIGIFEGLGRDLHSLRRSGSVSWLTGRLGGRSSSYDLEVEVVSELEGLYELVYCLLKLRIPFDKKGVAQLVSSYRNTGGSYGDGHRSVLATTYYAAQTLTLLGQPVVEHQQVLSFLRRREPAVYFMEDLYYLPEALQTLDEGLPNRDYWVSFVLDCQRSSGGFARTRVIGIATLEYTYYAMCILDRLGVLPGRLKAEIGGRI